MSRQRTAMSYFNPLEKAGKGTRDTLNFDLLRIMIASPERIASWSHGEVKKPETINYRTFKPERDGLFCARIFGPVKDHECLCGKYKRPKYRGIVCEKCGVEVTSSTVRRERMGHVELAAPVAHIWFLRSMPSRIGLMLDMTLRSLESVLYYENFIVIDPGATMLKEGQMLSEEEYAEKQDEYGADSFTAEIGAEAARSLLSKIDLEELRTELRQELATSKSEIRTKKAAKRLHLVEAFIHSGNRPEWMILTRLPVLPPELRPLVPLEGGRFATSDLNDLYRRVINRSNRLKRLSELRAPDIIIRNEKRMLQESVDALFDNGRRGRAIAGISKRPLKSLADMLKGKQGRFRQNLLGKRVDFSGRSVIVVGPELKLHQCGLPKTMALKLFTPFIYARLMAHGYAATLKQAKKLVENEHPEVWDILEDVIREHPVLLNRAPTLHRLGIQAFEPVLIEGKAIQLHPLVCTAFNADFDGDQMAVHVPLSLEARVEARVLMMSTNNILHPAHGRPIIVPSKDIVLGLYALTLDREAERGEGSAFQDLAEIRHALHAKTLNINAHIKARRTGIDEDGKEKSEVVKTTAGRMILDEIFPRHKNLPFSLINRQLSNDEITSVIDSVYRHCGQKETIIFCDKIMELGFRHACEAGVSLGKDDMIVPSAKGKMIGETRQLVGEFEQQFAEGLITRGEKYNKVVDAWSKCTDRVADAMMEGMSARQRKEEGKGFKPLNSIYMMADSGARGSPAQMKQLAGMRGLMARPSGEIIETPIISNFKEGLTVLEYFNSTHGARKGLADTALKTANSGYLTRRLVDVAQDCITTTNDCGTKRGISVATVEESGQVIVSLAKRSLGRVPVENILDPANKKVIAPAGKMIGEVEAAKIEESGLRKIILRSPLTCDAAPGICTLCYGRDLARGSLVNIGEAVGVIAAQSIGEPGTQLTMRTFHIGGAAQVVDESFIEAPSDGRIEIENRTIVVNSAGENIAMGRNNILRLIDDKGVERLSYKLIDGARVMKQHGEKVNRGDRLAEWDPYTKPIVSDIEGVVEFEDLTDGLSVQEVADETTGITQRVVIDWHHRAAGTTLLPALVIRDKKGALAKTPNGADARYMMTVGTLLSVAPGEAIKAGDILARIPMESARTRDITGGLPRVAELFEARIPRNQAILASVDGRVEFLRDYKNKRRIALHPKDGGDPVKYLLPKVHHMLVRDGDEVERGEFLVDGHPAPHDILDIWGVEELAHYLVNGIQEVYRLQGVHINDKHIEVIIRQMLQKVEITNAGDSSFMPGEQVDRIVFAEANAALKAKSKTLARAKPVLLGITRASLQTRSFISAASFQDTTRVLTEAAVSARTDDLLGLKENVIVGRLIPAGTGGLYRQLRHEADARDQKAIAEKEAAAAALAEEAAAEAATEAEEAGEAPVSAESAG